MNPWAGKLRKVDFIFQIDVIILCKKEREKKKKTLLVLPTPHYHTGQSVSLV